MTMTTDDLKNLPPISTSEKSIINNAEAIPTEDCPEMNEADLKEFKPWYDRREINAICEFPLA